MAKATRIGSPLVALAMASKLDAVEFGVVAGLIAVWLIPNWLYKLLKLGEAWRRYRARQNDRN